jgi:hypothetical protein
LSAKPSTSTAAFIAPAEVPEMPSMPSQGSSSRRSSTPQVNAPCAPPPCSAKSTRMGARFTASGFVVILVHRKGEPRRLVGRGARVDASMPHFFGRSEGRPGDAACMVVLKG